MTCADRILDNGLQVHTNMCTDRRANKVFKYTCIHIISYLTGIIHRQTMRDNGNYHRSTKKLTHVKSWPIFVPFQKVSLFCLDAYTLGDISHPIISFESASSMCMCTLVRLLERSVLALGVFADMLLIDTCCIKAAIETKYLDQLSLTVFSAHTAF